MALKCPSDINLKCENGGHCKRGKGGLGYHGTLEHIPASMRDESIINSSNHDKSAHCACPHGFTGYYCEIPVETCGQNNHACFHGGRCKKMNENYQCICNHRSPFYDVNKEHNEKNNLPVSIGKSCEHKATSYCGKDQEKKSFHSFCTNGGTCKALISNENEGTKSHKGCHCKNGFSGEHCELFLPSDVHAPDVANHSKSKPMDVVEEDILVTHNDSLNNTEYSLDSVVTMSFEENKISNTSVFLISFFVLACIMGIVFYKTQARSKSKHKSTTIEETELSNLPAMKGESC